MTALPPTTPPAGPALIVPCSGLDVRPVSATHAEVIVTNPLVRASLIADADQLRTVADALTALAGQLEAPGPKLVTPSSAGRLVGPSGGAL